MVNFGEFTVTETLEDVETGGRSPADFAAFLHEHSAGSRLPFAANVDGTSFADGEVEIIGFEHVPGADSILINLRHHPKP